MALKEYEMEYEPEIPVREAEENLRIIRDLMERSTKYSTFSGLSGVLAGLVSIAGCLVQYFVIDPLSKPGWNTAFLLNWSVVILLAIGFDYLLTKRRAPLVGKRIVSRLGKQMVLAAAPGLGSGALLTLVLLQQGLVAPIYALWMLAYGTAVCSIGLFSQKEVSRLGWAFLAAGSVTLLLQSTAASAVSSAQIGLVMMAVAFGGFHIAYGLLVSRRGGW
jgi:hypothetical protein